VISDPKPRVSVGAFKSESAVVQRDAGGVEILPMDFCYFLEAFSSNFLGLAPNIEGRIKPMIIYKCDLCGELRNCVPRQIEQTEYDICSDCWNELTGKLKQGKIEIGSPYGPEFAVRYHSGAFT
jgi:hypothetical protein